MRKFNTSVCEKVCNECPFLENSLPGWLGPHSAEEILEAQQFEQFFSCHMQRGDETTDEDIEEGRVQLCKGFILSASKSFKLFGQNPITGQELLRHQKNISKEKMGKIMNRNDFFKHHMG